MSGKRALVVGGGPAGCAAAIEISRSGASVTLLERGSRDRPKPCGDACTVEALHELAELGLENERLTALGGRPYDRITLTGASGVFWELDCGDRGGTVIPRQVLDQALRDLVPGEIVYEATTTEVVVSDGAFVVHTKGPGGDSWQRADAVVLAHGASGTLSRRFGVDGRPVIAASTTAYCPGESEGLVFHFGPEHNPGYAWLFALEQGLMNIGVCSFAAKRVRSGLLPRARAAMPALVDEARETLLWRGGVGTLWGGPGHLRHHPAGLVSCGDAAGLVDPFTGEGVAAALASGRQAGRAIADFLEGRGSLALAQYSRAIDHKYSERYRLTALRKTWADICGSRIVHPGVGQ